jgi:hypothetical protein
MFVVEDELHAEQQGSFPTWIEAIAELERRSKIPWNDPPNLAPCTNWAKCGRSYEVVEYDDNGITMQELSRTRILDIYAAGIHWSVSDG